MTSYLTKQLIADHEAEQKRRKEWMRELMKKRKPFVLKPAPIWSEWRMSSFEIDRNILKSADRPI